MTNTWIFQANPDRFDIDGFLATKPSSTSWLVTRYATDLRLGDDVYIWRARGREGSAKSGIVAKAQITSGVEIRKDDPQSIRFWKGGEDANAAASRVRINFERIANKRQLIQRAWVLDDPILRELTIVKIANGTNYAVEPRLAARLDILWNKVDTEWTYAETLGGLWAFLETQGKQVSKPPGSPVADTSLFIGRPISGVYNKVMNFRALDPRDERKGLDGTTEMDSHVWDKFFDAELEVLDASQIESEMARFWGKKPDEKPADDAIATDTAVEEDARKLLSLDLETLMKDYNSGRSAKPRKPPTKRSTVRSYQRDPRVIAIAKLRAGFKCEVPQCKHPTFLGKDGFVFSEVHHIEPLAEGGEDTIENAACICPAHHREVHHGKEATKIREGLLKVRS